MAYKHREIPLPATRSERDKFRDRMKAQGVGLSCGTWRRNGIHYCFVWEHVKDEEVTP